MRLGAATHTISVLVIALASCSGAGSASAPVTISVASSLTEQFTALEEVVEAQNPDIDVRLNIAGSATLVSQIEDGAAVDIVALADQEAADKVASATLERLALPPNHLVVIQPAGSVPAASLAELAATDLRISACDPTVPCGRLTELALAGEGAGVEIDSLETNVRVVRERVRSGDADAGFVYATDVVGVVDDLVVAPVDLSGYENRGAVALLTDDDRVRTVFDLIAAELAPESP